MSEREWIREYSEVPEPTEISFQTDLAIKEVTGRDHWKPRVIIEAKLETITTHDAITYSHKAAAHRAVHPYLRYGVMLGARKKYPLPGRLYRHGTQFDFMISFVGHEPTEQELVDFVHLLHSRIEASRTLEKMIYESRKPGRDQYTVLQRRLDVK